MTDIKTKETPGVTPIKEDLRPVLEGFLAYKPVQPLLLAQAKANGYKGEDPTKAKATLFTIDIDGQIGFNNPDIAQVFERFQMLIQGKHHLKTLFLEFDKDIQFDETPEEDEKIVEIMVRLKSGEEVTEEDIIELITSDTKENA